MRYWRCLVASVLALALPAAAQAEWYEASSDHFVVYADDTERDVRTFSQQLESFHRAMEFLGGNETKTPSPSNRVTIFVVDGTSQVQQLAGDGARNIAGFYVPRAGGSVAFVPRLSAGSGKADFSMVVLLHEYAHHFIFSNSAFPLPRWMSEGAAEFFASAEFARDGTVKIGMPADHRVDELLNAIDVRAIQLLDPDTYKDRTNRFDAYYGKSWLLYHYLTFSPERQGQMRTYLVAMIGGKSSREAAEQAFGDLGKLEGDLVRYMRQRSLSTIELNPALLGEPAINLRRLSAGEESMMPVRLRSRRGVTREEAIELLTQARVIAARFPQDAAVLAALSEAEFDAGNDAEAIAAADASIARDPGQVNAYVQKGYALFRRAAGSDDSATAYQAAVQPFAELNRIENDHPLPLIYFYRSFTDRGATPSALAIQGLERAAQLAPFDLGLRLEVARQEAMDGRLDAARGNLVPIAYHPHGGAFAEQARKAMERLDGGPLGPEEIESLFSPPKGEEESEPASIRRWQARQTVGRATGQQASFEVRTLPVQFCTP